ncbi:BRE1-domain-containing protein [Trametes elegans]|nr:BRE1-domain-containing protein [Trametes elegans]
MESRKRPHADDAELSRPKKRAVSDDRASPSHLNGTTTSHSDEPKDTDSVELFRKEAIYRRMKHYSREAERSQARVADLERRRGQCEAGLAALEACWTQLIGTIRSLVKSEEMPSLQQESEAVHDLAERVSSEAEPEYVNALRDKMRATSDIVKAFASLGAEGRAVTDEETLKRCQQSEAENAVLRSELSLVRTRLRDAESQKEKFREELVAAEKRADRLQSKSLNPHAPRVDEELQEGPSTEHTSSPQPPVPNGTPTEKLGYWQELASSREAKITELVKENSEIRTQLAGVKIKLDTLPKDVIENSTHFRVVKERMQKMANEQAQSQAEIVKLQSDLNAANELKSKLDDAIKASDNAAIQDLKQVLGKRDEELARIRSQRDQHFAELTERRSKDILKSNESDLDTDKASSEFRSLAEARADRITVLESENKRLKTRLAAGSGDEDLMTFLWANEPDGPSYVADLRRKLSEAEARVSTLERTLASVQDSDSDVAKLSRSEAELQQQVEQLQKQLGKYQAVYGDASTLPPDTAQLSEQLRHKQDEIDKLRVQEKQREQAEVALYTEVDRLSVAWEALDRQVKRKVYDLAALEERLLRTNTERAKAENKFYAAVRDKEAHETERKNLARHLEKANKAMDKLKEQDDNLAKQTRAAKKEVEHWQQLAKSQQEQAALYVAENQDLRIKLQGEQKVAQDFQKTVQEQWTALNAKRTELRLLEESLLKTRKDLEKQAARQKASSSSSGSSTKEAELQSEIDKCMSILKCSTCKMNMRNTVITKCMHSFCKSCVEARIATRQRKCPACNLPFSQGEVQQLYFQ